MTSKCAEYDFKLLRKTQRKSREWLCSAQLVLNLILVIDNNSSWITWEEIGLLGNSPWQKPALWILEYPHILTMTDTWKSKLKYWNFRSRSLKNFRRCGWGAEWGSSMTRPESEDPIRAIGNENSGPWSDIWLASIVTPTPLLWMANKNSNFRLQLVGKNPSEVQADTYDIRQDIPVFMSVAAEPDTSEAFAKYLTKCNAYFKANYKTT